MDRTRMSAEELSALNAFGEKWATEFEKNFEPDPTAPIPPLMALQHAATLRAALDRRIPDDVERARAAGISWEKIGGALGVTGETARLRYGGRS